MGERTGIEWTESTWNPIRAMFPTPDGPKLGWHCEHASPGCANCYAEGINKRLGTGFEFKPGHLVHENKFGDHRGDISIFLDEKMLLAPLRWKRARKIFVCSMTDLFADFVPDEIIDRIFAVMALCPQHTFQVLTKRSARMRAYFSDSNSEWRDRVSQTINDWPSDQIYNGNEFSADLDLLMADNRPLRQVWLGVSVEDQQRANERIPDLLQTPAAVRLLSCEPLISAVDLRRWMWGWHPTDPVEMDRDLDALPGAKIDWVIAGGESGPRARPMETAWAESLRDQCKAAGVAFFMKQMARKAPIPPHLMVREMPA